MRKIVPEKLENGRIREGRLNSDASYGMCGAFRVVGPCGVYMLIVVGAAEDPIAEGWEHVSVSLQSRNPNWQEMCFVKDLCWTDDELVLQFHPPKALNIDIHSHCLHLWRPQDGHIKLPPRLLV
jgi:hypothetical protein